MPTLQAHQVPGGVADIVAKGVIAWLAPLPAAFTVVVLLANNTILVAEGRMGGVVVISCPRLPQFQPALGHKTGYESRA